MSDFDMAWDWHLTISGGFLPSSPTANDGYVTRDYWDQWDPRGLKEGLVGDLGTVRALPYADYTVDVSGMGVLSGVLYVAAPQGYQVQFDGMPRNAELFQNTDISIYYERYITFRVVPISNGPGGPAGSCTHLSPGKLDWHVSLGNALNGDPIGELAIVGTGWESGAWTFSPYSVLVQPYSDELTFAVVSDAENGPHQVQVANEAVVEIVAAGTNGAEIRFFTPAQLRESEGTKILSGEPYIKYKLENGGSSRSLKITKETRNIPDADATGVTVARRESTTLAVTGDWPNLQWTLSDWTVDGGDVQVEGTENWASTDDGQHRTTDSAIQSPGEAAALRTSSSYSMHSWGEALDSATIGSGPAAGTTTFSYVDDQNNFCGYGYLRSKVSPTGSWEAFDYTIVSWTDDRKFAGIPGVRYRPWNGQPATPTFDYSQGEVTNFSYVNDPFGYPTRPYYSTTKINNVIVKRVAFFYADAGYLDPQPAPAGHHLPILESTRKDSISNEWQDPQVLQTVTRYFREDTESSFYRKKPLSVLWPDGVKKVFAYQHGAWDDALKTFTKSSNNGIDSAGGSRIVTITGTQDTGDLFPTYDGYDIDDVRLISGKSTMDVVIRNDRAEVCRTESYVWNAGAWAMVSFVNYTYDFVGRLLTRVASNGATYSAVSDGQLVTDVTDEQGVTTSYTYDDAGRVETKTRVGAGAIASLTTKFTYNAIGQVKEERIGDGSGMAPLVSLATYDDAGRLTSSTPAGMGTSSIAYSLASRTRTVTTPDLKQTIQTSNLDGRLLSVTGSAVVPSFYSYGVESDGRRWTQVNSGFDASPRWSKSWIDMLDRQVRSERPGFNGQSSIVSERIYSADTGRLNSTTTTGFAPTYFQYDPLGQIIRSGLDVNQEEGHEGLELASEDRIVDSDRYFEKIGSDWWLRAESWAYPDPASSARVSLGYSQERVSGHPASRLGETRIVDGEGNVETRYFDVNRSAHTAKITAVHSGLTQADEVQNLEDGMLVSATGHDGLGGSIEYDNLLRTWKTTNSRHQTTTISYIPGTGLVQSAADAAGPSMGTYLYDGMGRVQSVKRPADSDNPGDHFSYFEYNDRGQLLHQWGSATQPVEYGYDSTYGDRTAMRTYRGGSGWDQNAWPTASTGPADLTQWHFDPASGLLWYKTDAAGQSTVHRYDEAGRLNFTSLIRRRQASGAPQFPDERSALIVRYAYDGATGELLAKHYNDNAIQTADELAAGDPAVPEAMPTPDVTYAYNRLGQPKTITDGTGTHAFAYDPGKPWRLATETLDASYYAGRVLTRLYQTTGILGRDRGFKLGAGVDSASDLQQTFTFSTDGRFDTVTSERAGDSGTDRTFDYGYFPDSSLLGSLDSGSFHVAWDYEANRNLLKSINTAWTGQGQSITRYDYTHNSLNQRLSAMQSGSAFADYGEATFRHFRYNPRGELVEGFDYMGSNIADLSRPLPGRHHEYDYDSGGNRTSGNHTGDAGLAEHYTANALNEYTSKGNTTLPVSGTAAPGAAVAVAIGSGSAPADRQGAYWSRDMAVGNAGHPWSGMITTYAAAGGSVRADSNRPAQLPALSQTLSYDLDGNLSSDGMWDYGYDAENRLVSMETTLAARSAGIAWRVLRFSYDYAGRRVQKIVLHGADLSFDSGRRYVYDGWNLIAEYDTTGSSLGALRRSYTWGIGFAGAGGAGALLQIADHTANKTYLPTYDGNGNVAALVRADGDDAGTVAAAYEYSPFGESLRADVHDATVADQPFRLSTQFTDIETGLIYYGMRYYSPALGRFINRDPIGEAGGLNLYGFCGNDGVNRSDYLGMFTMPANPFDPSFMNYRSSDDSIDDGGVLDGIVFGFVASLPAIDVDDTSWVPANYSVPDAYLNATSGVSRFPTDQPQTKAGAKDVASSSDDLQLSIRDLDGAVHALGHVMAERVAEAFQREKEAQAAAHPVRSLEEAHRIARDRLLANAKVTSWHDEPHIIIRKRTDLNGTYYELSEILLGGKEEIAHIPESSLKIIIGDPTVVGLAHVHPAGRGRLSGDDIRSSIKSGISISAVAVTGDYAGEAEVFLPVNERGAVPMETRESVWEWQQNYENGGKGEYFNRNGPDLRFVNAPIGYEKYAPKESLKVIDVPNLPKP